MFWKKGIKNYAQLFNAYDHGSLNCGKNVSQNRIIKALRGTVEILKYKYFGEYLLADTVLDKVSFPDPALESYYYMPGTKIKKYGDHDIGDIIRLGFTWAEYMELENYFDKMINKNNVPLIQLLQIFYNDETFCEIHKDYITDGYLRRRR